MLKFKKNKTDFRIILEWLLVEISIIIFLIYMMHEVSDWSR
jgi:hypothetical protein